MWLTPESKHLLSFSRLPLMELNKVTLTSEAFPQMNSRQDLALLILECENHSIFTGHGEMLFARGGVNGFVGDGSRVGE